MEHLSLDASEGRDALLSGSDEEVDAADESEGEENPDINVPEVLEDA